MCADDLMCATRTQAAAPRAILIVEDVRRRLELTINRKKSGVMMMYKRAPKSIFRDIHWWSNIGTLGPGWEEPSRQHLIWKGEPKSYVHNQKTGTVQVRDGHKFNTDLFRVLVLPGMRMIGAVHKLDRSCTFQ